MKNIRKIIKQQINKGVYWDICEDPIGRRMRVNPLYKWTLFNRLLKLKFKSYENI